MASMPSSDPRSGPGLGMESNEMAPVASLQLSAPDPAVTCSDRGQLLQHHASTQGRPGPPIPEPQLPSPPNRCPGLGLWPLDGHAARCPH